MRGGRDRADWSFVRGASQFRDAFSPVDAHGGGAAPRLFTEDFCPCEGGGANRVGPMALKRKEKFNADEGLERSYKNEFHNHYYKFGAKAL